MTQTVKNLPVVWETRGRSLGWEDALKKEMATPLQYSCLGNHKLKTGAHQGHLPSVSAETESCVAMAINL